MTAKIVEIGDTFHLILTGFDSIDVVQLTKLFADTKSIKKTSLYLSDTNYKGEAVLKFEAKKTRKNSGYYKERIEQ